MKNKERYHLKFSEYVVHHRDRDKLNNSVNNLDIVTKEEHNKIHKLSLVGKKELDEYQRRKNNKSISKFKYQTPEERINRKTNLKRIILAISIILLILISFLFLKINLKENKKESPPGIPQDLPIPTPTIQDVEVSVEGFNINIKNNLQTPVYVNVTYRQYSKWFRVDNTITITKLVNPNNVEVIRDSAADTNIATSNAPYSISIIDYTYST